MFDRLTNIDSREGFLTVGFDNLNEFDNPVVRDEYHNWLDSHYPDEENEVDDFEDVNEVFNDDEDFDEEYDAPDYEFGVENDDVDEYTEWQDYMGGDDSPYDWDSDCQNEW